MDFGFLYLVEPLLGRQDAFDSSLGVLDLQLALDLGFVQLLAVLRDVFGRLAGLLGVVILLLL